ncbi:MAG TPA: AraC family transcriptional regulator [Stellaceae bacterium]
MPGGGTQTFTDPDRYQASLRQARVDLLVTSFSDFKARLTWAELHQLRLSQCEEDLPRIAYASVAPSLLFVAFPTIPDPPPLWGGVEVQLGDIMVLSRGERQHQRTRGRSAWSLMSLAPSHLEEHGRALFGKDFAPPPPGRVLRPSARDAKRLRRLHAQACRLAETRPNMLAHAEVARAVEQGLMHALVTCLTAADALADLAAKRRHAAIMVRFEEVLAEHLSRPLHLPELCELIGVTDRALRSCCAEFLAVTPSRYVLLRRLNQARIALREADPAATSIAHVAQDCGFTELGRFAVAYRMAFGEMPLATLRRVPRSEILGPIFSESA